MITSDSRPLANRNVLKSEKDASFIYIYEKYKIFQQFFVCCKNANKVFIYFSAKKNALIVINVSHGSNPLRLCYHIIHVLSFRWSTMVLSGKGGNIGGSYFESRN